MLMQSPKRVLVTRARQQGSELAERLRSLGAEPVLLPAIELVEPTSFDILDAALGHLDRFDWLLFTSANAVTAFVSRLRVLRGIGSDSIGGRGFAPPAALRLAAIGGATAQAMEENLGVYPEIVPPQAVAESLAGCLLPYVRRAGGAPTSFLLVRAEEAREHLPQTLRAAGAEVTVAPAYRTVIPAGSVELVRTLFRQPGSSRAGEAGELWAGIAGTGIDAVTFTSSSSARNLVALCEGAGVRLPPQALRISIGPITSQTLRELGLPPHAQAPEATVAALAETVLSTLAARNFGGETGKP